MRTKGSRRRQSGRQREGERNRDGERVHEGDREALKKSHISMIAVRSGWKRIDYTCPPCTYIQRSPAGLALWEKKRNLGNRGGRLHN